MSRRGTSPKSPTSKFTVVGLRDQLSHHTSQLWVYMYKVRHGTRQSCRCLEDEERNCRWLALLPDIVLILHGSLLNHMTIVTKVGVSYDDHMNDDTPEVDSFSCRCYQALFSPHFWGESLETRLIQTKLQLTKWTALKCRILGTS